MSGVKNEEATKFFTPSFRLGNEIACFAMNVFQINYANILADSEQ